MMRTLIVLMVVVSLLFSGVGVASTYAFDWSGFLTPTMGASDNSSLYKGISLGVLLVAVGGILWLGFKTDMEGVETIQVAPEKSETPSLFVDLGDFTDDVNAFQMEQKPVDMAGRIGVRLYF